MQIELSAVIRGMMRYLDKYRPIDLLAAFANGFISLLRPAHSKSELQLYSLYTLFTLIIGFMKVNEGLSRFKPSSSVVNHTRLLLVLMAQLVGASLSGLCRTVRNRVQAPLLFIIRPYHLPCTSRSLILSVGPSHKKNKEIP